MPASSLLSIREAEQWTNKRQKKRFPGSCAGANRYAGHVPVHSLLSRGKYAESDFQFCSCIERPRSEIKIFHVGRELSADVYPMIRGQLIKVDLLGGRFAVR
ncbi:hypothetical protein BaRGS_00010321 [Batillaria attramentaria]|uniref:Uncharacterized protein n=1 Tax=Batillaria attramentaria TaxID=370345 RepID=A0ABD0LGC1_9CAEN